MTADVARADLKTVFESTWGNQFTFRPDAEQFFAQLKHGTSSKPMLLLCQDYLMFKHYYSDFQDSLADYADQFELFYTDDQSKIDRYVDHNLRKSHMLPVVILADPMQRTNYEKAARNA